MIAGSMRFWRWLVRRLRPSEASAVQPSGRSSQHDFERVRRQYLESEQRFRALLESLPKVAVQGYDRERRVIYWNEASTRLYGYCVDEAWGQRIEDLIIPHLMRDKVIAQHRAWIRKGQNIPPAELELRHRSGERVPVFSHHVMLGEHTESPLMFCIDMDLSEQKRAHRELEFATRFDHLTHLPNRQTFKTELDEVLADCRSNGSGLTVFYLDLDHFAEINEALGYGQGDRLLIELSHRLRHELRTTDLLSRIGSDEFVMAFPGVDQQADVLRLAARIQGALRPPFVVNGGKRLLTAGLGASCFPAHGLTAGELIRNADVAKNRAKLDGGGGLHIFHQSLHDELVRQNWLAERLEQAIGSDELSLHYQPQVAAVSGRIESVEALLRWTLADGSSISPAEFIPVGERSDLIHRLGDWVLEEACRQQTAWRAAGIRDLRIDINLSGRQMARSDVLERFEACLERHELSHRDIGIELTENVLIAADSRILDELRRLHHRGVRVAIDDFGTGYSSLSYLKHFPITAIKIDRTFVQDAPLQPQDRAIMEAVVFIGHRLGLEVVAEGVENAEQLALVREIHCDLAQGYYFFRPMPASAIERLWAGLVMSSPGLSE